MFFGDKELIFDKPLIMGIINLTPDSFSDGGKFLKKNSDRDIDKNKVQKELEVLENNKKKSFLLNQLQTFCKDSISPGLLAYEPIWAIGTGKEADSGNIASAVSIILDFFENKEIDCPILYGGSVSKNNIEEIISIPGIDGCLVGNSSLDGKQFAIIASKIKS